MYDLIIKNGTIVDGTGAPGYAADVALKGGKIARIAKEIPGGGRILDASGLTVTPGFIDSHSHSDRAILPFPEQAEKVEQGVTTAIAGQCGSTSAPGREHPTMGDFLAAVKNIPQGANTALFVGHNALRLSVIGPDNREPSPEELQRMKDLLAEGVDSGAMGVSFGLIYPPSGYAKTGELVHLARTAAEHGGLVAAHIRNEGDTLVESAAEFIDVLRQSGARGVLSHHKAAGKANWGKVRQTLKMLDDAVAEGIDIYCDVYPYVASSTSLSVRLVPKPLHNRGTEGLVEILSDPAQRQAIREHCRKQWADDLSWILVTKCPAYPQYEGLRLNEIAERHGTNVYDAAFDMIRDSRNVCSACYFTMSEDDVKTALAHPRAMIGTDSSVAGRDSVYHPRLRGTFPRVLGRYVREAGVSTLEEMIRKMTSLPAEVYGLTGKGRIAEGFDADLCVFDPKKIIDRADYAACHRRAEGLNYVLVGGEIVAEDAIHNGKRMGKVLLRNQ